MPGFSSLRQAAGLDNLRPTARPSRDWLSSEPEGRRGQRKLGRRGGGGEEGDEGNEGEE